jgi:hypothetical protein
VYPVLFMGILYFMADLRRTVPCFFLTLLATLLIVFTSQVLDHTSSDTTSGDDDEDDKFVAIRGRGSCWGRRF